tara:strand:- start:6026 stop:7630 length:1605 start_codon:yes stop_codon:yes gene_type:complete
MMIQKHSLYLSTILAGLITQSGLAQQDQSWVIDSAEEWKANQSQSSNLEFTNGLATAKPNGQSGTYLSMLKKFKEKKSLQSVQLEQTSKWLNWKKIPNVGPKNAQDAPVFLTIKDKDYWIFARYSGGAVNKLVVETLKIEEKIYMGKMTKAQGDAAIAKLREKNEQANQPKLGGNFADKDPNQTNGTGGTELGLGGYHAWHSNNMKTWVHHGPVSNYKSRWMTTAEYKDGEFYLYYDNPNDQDPHLIIDSDLTDGKMGKDIGLVFADPSNGSDNAVIRGEDGKFHFIYEDWSPLNASKQAWDSPLAGHAISPDGIKDWKILDYALDLRTKPTGKVKEYRHPHQNPAMLKYNEHFPKQDAFGDWAGILVGEQYYLFADYDPAKNKKGKRGMSAAWFTSASLDEEFKFCGDVGQGHPDPDITFAEGKFYLITQFNQDFISPGPWVAGVAGRAGVDTDNDGKVDQWTEWQEVIEEYSHKPGFAKHVVKTPAAIDSTSLPNGFGFQFELKLAESLTETVAHGIDAVRPELDKITLKFK